MSDAAIFGVDANHPIALAWAELLTQGGVLQALSVVACVALAWMLGRRLILPRFGAAASGVPAIDTQGTRSFLVPGLVWLLLVIARPIVGGWTGMAVLSLAAALFAALALARLMVFLARRAFPTSSLLATFQKVIGFTIWGAFALHLTGLLPELAEFLEAIRVPIGKQSVSFLTILQGAFWVMVVVLVALWIGAAIEARLMRAEALHSSLRVALARLVRAVLVVIGVLIALPLVGIDLTVLSVFSGALGVGLGFGLQKIASNYVSGFIVLLERSVRIKDVVTVDNFNGEVRNLTTRYVVLRSLDGREAIIPNEKLITDAVINQSLSDPRVRVSTIAQVTYDTDIDRAIALLEDVARQHSRVVADPPPLAMLAKFADSGIDLELGFWIADPQNGAGGVRAEINREIWRTFARERIEFAYPRREVRILSDGKNAPMVGGSPDS